MNSFKEEFMPVGICAYRMVHEEACDYICRSQKLIDRCSVYAYLKESPESGLQAIASGMSSVDIADLPLSTAEVSRIFDEQETILRKYFYCLRDRMFL